jgi:hypothetical protein
MNCFFISDGSDGRHHGQQHWATGNNHDAGLHQHNHHQRHHSRQRRHGVQQQQKHLEPHHQDWSPSQTIHEQKRASDGSVKSEITFGHVGRSGNGNRQQINNNWVFLTKNASTVRAHIGSTAILPCEIKKDSQYGMVSHQNT